MVQPSAEMISLVLGIGTIVLCLYGLSQNRQKGEQNSMSSKWLASLAGGGLFLVLSNPLVYQATDKLARSVFGDSGAFARAGGSEPTALGIGAHAAVYALASRVLMGW